MKIFKWYLINDIDEYIYRRAGLKLHKQRIDF